MKLESKTHKAEVERGCLKVWHQEPDVLMVTTWTPEEGKVKETKPSPFRRTPLFLATYEGDDYFEIDLDCGFQRWHGSKTLSEVIDALIKCGFDQVQVSSIVNEVMLVEQSCPRVW